VSGDGTQIGQILSLPTRADFRTLHDAAVLTHPDASASAIIYVRADAAPITVTRAQFRRAVNQYADALRGLNVPPRGLVIIAHTQNLESIYAFWGALIMGAIPSMLPTLTDKLDPDIYMRNMAELVRNSAAAAVLTTDAFAPNLRAAFEQGGVPCPVFGSRDLAAAGAWGIEVDGSPNVQVDGSRMGQVDGSRNVQVDGNPIDDIADIPNASHHAGATQTIDGRSISQIASDSISQISLEAAPQIASDSISQINPDDIAFLQHSSGTTGLQKGVALAHRAVLNQLAAYADALDLRASDSIVSWLPLYHDMGLIAAFVQPLVQGIPLILMSPFEWVGRPILLLRAIHEYRPTLCWLPNFAYNHMAARIRPRDSDGLDVSSIRAFINCSEPVHHDSHAQFVTRFTSNGAHWGQIAVSYAMAENTFAVTQTPIGSAARVEWVSRAALQADKRAIRLREGYLDAERHVSCGKPIPNTRVAVVDWADDFVGEGRVGELVVQSDCMLTAYYQRPDLRPLERGWYRTGDIGFILDGDIYVIGRSKDLIIHAGKNVFPQDIEAVVNGVAGVHPGRAVAFGVPDANEGTELIAVVAETDAATSDERKRINIEIRKRVGSQTDVSVGYVELVARGWLIKTSSGKIARGDNRNKWLALRGKD